MAAKKNESSRHEGKLLSAAKRDAKSIANKIEANGIGSNGAQKSRSNADRIKANFVNENIRIRLTLNQKSGPPPLQRCKGKSISNNTTLRRMDIDQEVKRRTAKSFSYAISHVMHYGDLKLRDDLLSLYMGTNLANRNSLFWMDSSLFSSKPVNQCDADLLHF